MLYIKLDKKEKRTLATQIYNQIREKILHGELVAGEQLPTSRAMSYELSVSRNTVLSAYDMLTSEGFIYGIKGSGVFVSKGAQTIEIHMETMKDYQFPSLSNSAFIDLINFDSGIPALELFPRSKWNKYVMQAFYEAPISALGYDYPQGRPELRQVLSSYLKKTRGIECHPEQIIITTGAKQAFTLIAKCLLHSDSEVWLEDPTNDNVKRIFSYHTKNITAVEVDSEGIQTSLFPNHITPTLIFVTPSHQFPMGGILSIQRRLELLQFAKEHDCYILEDDYDSEFRYHGNPINSLFELDSKRVIYIGTFSKIMFPSLRLGYMVLPYSLIEQCKEWKRLSDHHSNSINQLALMRFIENGELERHIARMKKVYHKRYEYLKLMLLKYFPDRVKIYGEAAGMHLIADFEDVEFTEKLINKIRDAGVNIIPVNNHAVDKHKHISQIILGYAHLDQDKMEQGIYIIKSIIDLN